MCGIAGIIHRKGASDIGSEMTSMLHSLKHRGPDSTGACLPVELVDVRGTQLVDVRVYYFLRAVLVKACRAWKTSCSRS